MIHYPHNLVDIYPDGPASAASWHGRETCFYSGAVFDREEYAVQWAGRIYVIYLHPGCVVELTMRLLRDVHEIECLAGIEPLRHWNGLEEVLVSQSDAPIYDARELDED